MSCLTDVSSGVKISTRFLKRDKKTVDLVSDQKMKASTSVRHIVIPCSASARAELIPDIIRCYSRFFFFFGYSC